MNNLLIATVAVVFIAWLIVRTFVDRPCTVSEIPIEALPKSYASTGDFDQYTGTLKTDTRMRDAFDSALDRGFKWVEAVPVGNRLRIVGHTTSLGRDKSHNWQLGKP